MCFLPLRSIHSLTLVYLGCKFFGTGGVSLCSGIHPSLRPHSWILPWLDLRSWETVLRRLFRTPCHEISFAKRLFHQKKFPLLWLSFIFLPEWCSWSSFTSSCSPNRVPALSFRHTNPYSFNNQGARSCVCLSGFVEKAQVRFMHCQADIYFAAAPAVSAIVFYKPPWLFLRFFSEQCHRRPGFHWGVLRKLSSYTLLLFISITDGDLAGEWISLEDSLWWNWNFAVHS